MSALLFRDIFKLNGILEKMTVDTDEVKSIYYRVIQIADSFLESTSGLSIEGLKDYDPTIEDIAKNLRKLATIIKIFSGEVEENMAINASQCAWNMEQIATAVASNDEDSVNHFMEMLEKHVTVP